MPNGIKLVLFVAAAAGCMAAAAAQDVVIIKQVTEKSLAERYQVEAALAAIDACAAIKIQASVAIVDNNGNTRLTMLGDGGKPNSVEAARRKAYTSALQRRATSEIEKVLKENPHMRISPDAQFLLMAGGLPIRLGNDVIGGFGVSGGKPEQDEVCAQAGLEKIKRILQP